MPLASRRTLVYMILQCVKPPSWNARAGSAAARPVPSGMRPHWAVTVVATTTAATRPAIQRADGGARAGRRLRPTREAGHGRMIRPRGAGDRIRCGHRRTPAATRPSPLRRRHEPVGARRRHGRAALGHQGAVAASGLRPRQPRHAGQFAGDGQAGACQEAAGDLADRRVPPDPLPQRVGEASDTQRPEISERRAIEHGARDHQHRGLQLVEGPGEGGAVGHAGVVAQVRGSHLPLATQGRQHRAGGPAQAPRFLGAAHAPHGMEAGDHPWRQEHRLAAGELGVIHLAAPEEVVLQSPRQRRLVIGLRVARHHGVAPAADRHVQRRSGPPAIGETRGEPHLLDEVLGGEH